MYKKNLVSTFTRTKYHIMKTLLLSLFMLSGIIPTFSHQNLLTDMENKQITIRLVYPQWQGGIINSWFPDLPENDASRGYFLGAQILNLLAPKSSQQTVEVPVSLEIGERKAENGITDRKAIVRQTRVALEKISENNPDRIVTLGGECSASIPPFTYLAAKYPGDAAIIWIDAHPDINLPGDEYTGYHAMAMTACLGMGDEEIMHLLPGKISADKALLVGLRAWEKNGGTKERQAKLGLKSLSPAEVAGDSRVILTWLKETGASKVLIHFDLDVLDPVEIIAAVGREPDGMKIREVVRVINDIAAEYDVVGLTIAEPLPKIAIKIKNMLAELPLLQEN